jgi:hypothetical protein
MWVQFQKILSLGRFLGSFLLAFFVHFVDQIAIG